VLVIVPPNANTVIPDSTLTVTRPEDLSDWSAFLSLGALSLVSALAANPQIQPRYIDGGVVALDEILTYITERSAWILAVSVSVVTANYEAGLLLLRHAKDADVRIVTVIGGHHFTALPRSCVDSARYIDFGFVGNDVVGPFTALIRDLRLGRTIDPASYPGVVARHEGTVVVAPERSEPVFEHYDYGLADQLFQHNAVYEKNFRERVAPRVWQLIGRRVVSGVPVDIGRGCVKFANDDACSFCSIQPGARWRKQIAPESAWRVIERAWRNGYDYLYLTPDELALTFYPLLSAMRARPPEWWRRLGEDDRPVLVGYARADGICNDRRVGLLAGLGVRQLMVGMDAGSALSLAALNKPRRSGSMDLLQRAEQLYEQNWQAIRVARQHDMMIRAGFVVGHIGITQALLQENVERIKALLGAGKDVISAVDVEILLPEPGSRDYGYLTEPGRAAAAAGELGLAIDPVQLERVARKWRGRDVVPPELAMRDYIAALMPEVSFDLLAEARAEIRKVAKDSGIAIGE
jgi:radical SAM superfamily enzyme YgiQ (UPF0313 family)